MQSQLNSEPILDWNGNEVKAGMTIYFVTTKPALMGRVGLMMPSTRQTIWESEESAAERNNKEYWRLGIPHEVIDRDGKLFVTVHYNDEHIESVTYPMSMFFMFGAKPVIAIKGISDVKE